MTQRLRILHSFFGGDLFGNTLLCPTIGHGSRDRGTAYTEAPGAPNGLLARVYNGNGLADDLAAKDRALEILGERPFGDRRRSERLDHEAERQRREARCRAEAAQWAETQRRQRLALATWDAARDPRGTPVETYLNGRALDLTDDLAGTVLRWLPAGLWGRGTAPMMVALMRNIVTGEPQAIQRTALGPDGRKIGWANLTIMDEPVDFADYEGFTPAEFDHCVFCDPHHMMCPTGEPGGIERWASFGVNGKGVGSSLGDGHAPPGNDGPIFQEGALAARYRRVALPVETGPIGREDALRVPPALLRHDQVARQIVPKGGWGIVGRPDLLARRSDRELAIRAAAEAEMERQRKAGEWLVPPDQVYGEIAIRMQKEWEAQDRATAQAA